MGAMGELEGSPEHELFYSKFMRLFEVDEALKAFPLGILFRRIYRHN